MGKNFAIALLLPKYQSERESRKSVAVGMRDSANAWQGFAVALLIAITGVYYLVMANATATAGYSLKQIHGKITALDQQYKQMQVKIVEMQSISNVQQVPLVANMVQVSSVTYLKSN